MGQTVQLAQESAREVVAADCIEFPIVAGSCKWFVGLAKKLSPAKPAAAVHHLTAEPERTCYEWVRGKFDPPSRVLIKLLHSEAGWVVLEYLMRGCTQRWWLDVQRDRKLAAVAERFKAELDQTELNL